jgi:hypothetical protein
MNISAWPIPRGKAKATPGPPTASRAAIEEVGAAEIQDLVLHAEVNEFGDSPSITVYFHRDKPVRRRQCRHEGR